MQIHAVLTLCGFLGLASADFSNTVCERLLAKGKSLANTHFLSLQNYIKDTSLSDTYGKCQIKLFHEASGKLTVKQEASVQGANTRQTMQVHEKRFLYFGR